MSKTFKFNPSEWIVSTRKLKAVTRGIFINLLSEMYLLKERGKITDTPLGFSRTLGCSIEEIKDAIFELSREGLITVSDASGGASVTLINEPMHKEFLSHSGHALRQRRYRERLRGRQKNEKILLV